MSTPQEFREDEPSRYVEPWVGREDELDDEELAALYVRQGRGWGR
jgi:hypothetical protein